MIVGSLMYDCDFISTEINYFYSDGHTQLLTLIAVNHNARSVYNGNQTIARRRSKRRCWI